MVASDSTVSPAAANCCSRWERFTVSPTSVYSSRSATRASAAAASPVDSPRPSPKAAFPGPPTRVLISACSACIRGRGDHGPVGVVRLREGGSEHRHDSVSDELHDGAALTEDCLVHRRAVRAELSGELAGSACSAMVEYDLMSLISTVTMTRSVSPIGCDPLPELLRQPAGQQPG